MTRYPQIRLVKSGTLKNIIIHISSKQVAYDEAAADRAEREKEADDNDEDWGELFELRVEAMKSALRRTRLSAMEGRLRCAERGICGDLRRAP